MSKKTLPIEPAERAIHRLQCRYNSYDICCKASGWAGPRVHITRGCSANCDCGRMRKYDKEHGLPNDITYEEFDY